MKPVPIPATRALRSALAAAGVAITLGGNPAQAAIVGQWDFENGNLAATLGGKALTYADGAGGATQTETQFVTRDIGGQPAKVMRFPACLAPMGYSMPTPVAPNGDGTLVNQWTILFDVMYPTESHNKWRSFIETDLRLVEVDAELFVNTANGIGVSGQYAGVIQPEVWHRVAFVIDQAAGVNVIRKYIDGVEVGVQGAGGIDGRWALTPDAVAELFNDNDGDVSPGFVNSIQLHNVALTKGQIAAYGVATAAGLPTAVPSSLEVWIPSGKYAARNTDIGVVINDGDTTIADASIVLKLDGTPVASPQISRSGDRITVRKSGAGPFAVPSKHTLEIAYNDGADRTLSTQFEVVLFIEDFESLTLGPNVDEGTAGEAVWTGTPPTGWTVDNSQTVAAADDASGVTEWEGWGFANKGWWVQAAGDQERVDFARGTGTIAIADPDEWDDKGSPVATYGYLNITMETPSISIDGVSPNTVFLNFDSSWRPEGFDDAGPDGLETNNQTGIVTVSYDNGAPVEVIHWDSNPNGPFFKSDGPYKNENVIVELKNPAGAKALKLKFAMLNAGNDWWWAVDNIVVSAGEAAPLITKEPDGATRVVSSAVEFSVTASGTSLNYQWQKDGANITGANTASYAIARVRKSDAGTYRCVISNNAGTATTRDAVLAVLDVPDNADSLKQGLLAYLPFDANYLDASGNNRNGTEVGTPSIQPGKVGAGALKVTTLRGDQNFNFVTLGSNAEFPVGQTEDFTVAFWVKAERVAGDPSFVATKGWSSGGNTGWTIGTQGDGRIEWNYKRSDAGRVDLDYTAAGNALNNGNWAHVVVVWKINGNAETYLNGNLVDSRSIAPGTGDVSDPALSFNLGEDGTGAYDGGDWDGLLDDVAVWGRALTAGEVLTLYSYGYFGDSFFSAPALTAQLKAHLKFEGDFKDASGNATDGTAVGAPTFGAGQVGQAAKLRTSRTPTSESFNYVTLGTADKVHFGQSADFSVVFWAKLNEWASDPAFIANKDWGSGNNVGWVIATDGDGRLQWNYRRTGVDGLSRKDFDSVGNLFSDLGWHHVAVVFNINGQAVTYFDGNEFATDRGGAAGRKDIGPSTGNLFDPALPLNIGQDGTGHYSDSDLFDALMDDVGIWGRALSGREVAVVYNRGLEGRSIDGTVPETLPTLAFSVSGGQMTLTWTGQGFALQENPDVANPAGWTAVAGAGANSATVPISSATRFYRLKK